MNHPVPSGSHRRPPSYDLVVAYDERLAERIREVVGDHPEIREQKMFGGLAFLVGGNMAVAASTQGLMVRVDPEEGEDLIASGKAQPMEMRGRAMSGWLRVAADDVRTRPQLARWVDRGISRARALPPKDGR